MALTWPGVYGMSVYGLSTGDFRLTHERMSVTRTMSDHELLYKRIGEIGDL